jgi:hypothetical protein
MRPDLTPQQQHQLQVQAQAQADGQARAAAQNYMLSRAFAAPPKPSLIPFIQQFTEYLNVFQVFLFSVLLLLFLYIV